MQPPSGGTAQGFHRPLSSSTGAAAPCDIAGRIWGLQVLPTVVSVNAPNAVSTSTVDSASCMHHHCFKPGQVMIRAAMAPGANAALCVSKGSAREYNLALEQR